MNELSEEERKRYLLDNPKIFRSITAYQSRHMERRTLRKGKNSTAYKIEFRVKITLQNMVLI